MIGENIIILGSTELEDNTKQRKRGVTDDI